MYNKSITHISVLVVLLLSCNTPLQAKRTGTKKKVLAVIGILVGAVGGYIVYRYNNDPDMQKSIEVIKVHLGAMAKDINVHLNEIAKDESIGRLFGKIKHDAVADAGHAKKTSEELLHKVVVATVQESVHIGGIVVDATRQGLQ